jgi:stalled ribosome rescue protein Dom34
MSDRIHAIIWIDHREAKIFHIDVTDVAPVVVYSHASGRHLQHKANTTGSGHHGVDKEFFERVIAALAGIDAILITGPAGAKTELKNYMAEHHSAVAKRISAVEALDHPSDGALIALARKFFKADDRMRV